MQSGVLLTVGIVVMAASLAAAVAAAILFRASGKRLNRQLRMEYGEKRR